MTMHEDKLTDLMSRLLELGVEEDKDPMPSVTGSSTPLEEGLFSRDRSVMDQ